MNVGSLSLLFVKLWSDELLLMKAGIFFGEIAPNIAFFFGDTLSKIGGSICSEEVEVDWPRGEVMRFLWRR